jgi:nucleoside-diphosphate-sugar epimerase
MNYRDILQKRKFTVLGSTGFIGSNLANYLKKLGVDVFAPPRNCFSFERNLDHVVYCIGMTADFREKPYDTVRSHICLLLEILEKADFNSFVYLSSTRVYSRAATGYENTVLGTVPNDPEDLYNLSKMMGESICLSSKPHNVKIIRLSNVYGSDFKSKNFLFSIIRDAVDNKKIILKTSLASAKDYINIKDVVEIIPKITVAGKHKIYNVASGQNISHGEIVDYLRKKTGCLVEVDPDAKQVIFPRIDINRVRKEFGFSPSSLFSNLSALTASYMKEEVYD